MLIQLDTDQAGVVLMGEDTYSWSFDPQTGLFRHEQKPLALSFEEVLQQYGPLTVSFEHEEEASE